MHTHEQKSGGGRTLVCPICGKEFLCALSNDCWCAGKTVPAEVRDYLAARYDTCVCSDCLDRLIGQAAATRDR